jgi:iron(III) transport system substrate-binding protein
MATGAAEKRENSFLSLSRGQGRRLTLHLGFETLRGKGEGIIMRRLLALAFASVIFLAPNIAAGQGWVDPALLAAAKKEGSVTLFSANTEEVVLPQMKQFEAATGLKTDYIRGADSSLLARIQIENKAGKQSWDVISIQEVEAMPKEWLAVFRPKEAAHLIAGASDPEARWFGYYIVFNTPAYNTSKVKSAELPKSYEDFAKHAEWAGHVGIDFTDRVWLAGVVKHYGEEKGRKLVRDLAGTLHPTLYKGHLALARALGSGEYWFNLNNYLNLTLNVKLAGDPVDFFILDPVVVTYGQTGINAKAPHPNAARLLVEYMLSTDSQAMRTRWGYVPTRADVATNPPGILDLFKDHTLVRSGLPPEEDAKWQKLFNELFKQ